MNNQQILDDAWLGISVDEDGLFNPMDFVIDGSDKDDLLERIAWLMMRPEYFSFACKYMLNIELSPFQALILYELWNRKFPMLIGSRGMGKSFILSVYPLLRALFMPRRKVIVVGAAFRQSKVLFEYMDTIWKNAPILRDLCDSNSGPRRDVDRCVMHINQSTITCLPLGDGSKIRGQRANDIIADEFACLESGSLVETTNGLVRIEDFDSARKVEIYTGDNTISTEKPEKYIVTPIQDVYEIKLSNGYVVRCSAKHQLMTMNGWKTPLEINKGDLIEKAPVIDAWGNEDIDEKQAWLLGVLVSEGSVTNKNVLSVKNTDRQLISTLEDEYGFTAYHRDSYLDDRFGMCKESWDANLCDASFRKELTDMGLEHVTSHDKKIPSKILQSPKKSVISFLKGLFDGDGSCFLWRDGDTDGKIGLAYYSVSERLCRDVQVLMAKLGYDGFITSRSSKLSSNRQWMVRWNGETAFNAASMLNIPRFQKVLDKCHYIVKNAKPHYDKARDKWKINCMINGKKAQKRFNLREEAQTFLDNLRSGPKYRRVTSITKLDKQQSLYDYYLPKTNSFYAEGHRQHNSIPRDIFENVVAGFAAVSASPIEKVKQRARAKKAKELGIKMEEQAKEFNEKSNQIILSGTAYYDFNHFSDYWKRYKAIVNSQGDPNLLKDVFGEEPSPEFDWTEYSIIRMPVDKLPPGFMDEGQISRAKATIHSGIYNMEYGACFTTDSQGFFKRSLLEACTASMNKPILLPSGEVYFGAMLKGDPNKKYIFGVDPASEVDNFSIVIIELNEDHRRIVYSWTTNRQQHKTQLKSNMVQEEDFYSYCAKKIRQLMKVFPCVEIAIDAQGGGIAVMEALHDKDKIEVGEVPLWPTIDENKPKDTDDNNGLHILRVCQFARADWLAAANHGMRKDFEDKILLFPFFDSASIGLSIEEDKAANRIYDTLEDCVMEIEELKDELSMIVMTQTSTGRERWDTPEIKVAAGKKSRLRKDRYSSLLIANMSARAYSVEKSVIEYGAIGGFAQSGKNFDRDEKMFYGPSWFTEKNARYILTCVNYSNRIDNIIKGRLIQMSKEPIYRSWDSESQKQEAYALTHDSLEAYDGIQKAVAYGRRTSYIDIESNRSVRTSFLREDYDNFRPGEQIPSHQKRIMKMCMQAYDKVGIVRNVIDLMSDFAAQGLTIVHPNKNIEKFYRKWFNQINGVDRSERFLNYLYRCGNVVVKRRTAKLNREHERNLMRTSGADVTIDQTKIKKREIPWLYDFLNPVAVDIVDYGGQIVGKPEYVLNISKLTHETLTKNNNANKSIFKTLPDDLQKRLAGGDRTIKLDPDSVLFYHYKKDDWLLWANPMIYAILDDIIMLEKMKLADLAALDGAISNVRLWTIGDLDHKIIPTKAAINKLRDILASNVGGGTMDLVWGPELKFTESQSQVYRFLGSEKYQPVLTSIYAGLGIPPTLTGAATGGGYTNNYVSLKTLIERLEYGREILSQFWRQEMEIVRKAMGFRLPAEIHFDSIILSDEAAQKQLLINLADRDIISQETLLERFREIPSIERVRVRREEKDRRADVMPDKASPYHHPQHRDDIAKIALNKDMLSTDYLENMGLPTGDNKTPTVDTKEQPISDQDAPAPELEAGRPRFARDSQKRKQKRVLPRSSGANDVIWAMEAYGKVSDILNPIALNHFKKNNVRSLTKSELLQLDKLKLSVFANLELFSDIDEPSIKNMLDNNKRASSLFNQLMQNKVDEFIENNNRQPNINEAKLIYAFSLVESQKNNQ